MWARNLLFLGLLGGGLVTLTVNLWPTRAPSRDVRFDAHEVQSADFRSLVAQVDAAFQQQWAERKLEPAPRASDLALARRLSLALTGTIPSLQEIRQFEAQPSDQRIQWWLAGILQDRRYADYLAERLARAYVGTENGPFLVYRRRRFVSWLSDELMQNRPYDRIVRDLIASEGLWTDTPATNFLTVTTEAANGKNQPNPERLAGRVTRAFLGVRLDCAQCHDHPFVQEWKQSDFQGLAAFFGQVKQGFTGIYDDSHADLRLENRKTGAMEKIAPQVPFDEDLLPAQGSRRQQLAAWVTHPLNHYFAQATVNRFWALLFGRPLVEPVDNLFEGGDIPPVLRLLADDFAAHQFDFQRLLKILVATEVFQRDSAADFEITEEHDKTWAVFPLTRLRPEQVVGSILQAASLTTADHDSHILAQFARFIGEREFVKRYGDTGDDEFDNRGGTITQRLLVMNGELVKDQTKEGLFNASTRIGWLAPDERIAVETAYLSVLTRRPTAKEAAHFQQRLANGKEGMGRKMEDLYWTLINSTEFSWNH